MSQKSSKKPIFLVRKWSPQEVVLFLTLEVVLFLTLERLKRGTKTNSPAYIYIYAVKLLTGPRFAILIVTNWATLIVTNWATSFSHYKNRGFRWFLWCSVISVCFFQLFFSYLKIAFFKKRVQKLVFSIFSVLSYFFKNSLF